MAKHKRGYRKKDTKRHPAATHGPDSNAPSEEMNDSVDASASVPPTNTMEPTDTDQENVSTADAHEKSKMDQPTAPVEPINTAQTAAITSGKDKQPEETPCITCGTRVKQDRATILDLENKVDQHSNDMATSKKAHKEIRRNDLATLKQQTLQITELEGALKSEKESRTAAEKLLEGQRTEIQRLKTQLDTQAGSLAETCLQLQDAEAKNKKSDEVVLLFKVKCRAQKKHITELQGENYVRDASDAASSVAGDSLEGEQFTAEEDATRQEEGLMKSEATTSSAGPSEKAQSMPSFLTKFNTGGEFRPHLIKQPNKSSRGKPALGPQEDQSISVTVDIPPPGKATDYHQFFPNLFNQADAPTSKPTHLYSQKDNSTQTTEDEITSQAAIPKDDLPLTTDVETQTEEVETAIPKDGSTQTEDAPTAILKNMETQIMDAPTTEDTATQTPPIVPVPFYQRLSLQHWFFLLAACLLLLLLLITLFTFYHGLQARAERAMWLAANDYSRRAVIYHRTASMRGQWVGWLTSSKMRDLGVRYGRGFGKYGVEM